VSADEQMKDKLRCRRSRIIHSYRNQVDLKRAPFFFSNVCISRWDVVSLHPSGGAEHDTPSSPNPKPVVFTLYICDLFSFPCFQTSASLSTQHLWLAAAQRARCCCGCAGNGAKLACVRLAATGTSSCTSFTSHGLAWGSSRIV